MIFFQLFLEFRQKIAELIIMSLNQHRKPNWSAVRQLDEFIRGNSGDKEALKIVDGEISEIPVAVRAGLRRLIPMSPEDVEKMVREAYRAKIQAAVPTKPKFAGVPFGVVAAQQNAPQNQRHIGGR